MKEATLYQRFETDLVRCGVCSHRCVIAPGRRGICRVRENQDGTLVTLNWGKAVAAQIDPIEKKPLFHFLQGTRTYSFAAEGCNLNCGWCQNQTISHRLTASGTVLGEDILPGEHVKRALRAGCPSISYTYGEPTVFLEYALDTMMEAKAKGLMNVWVSNGFMSPEALDALLPYLDAANIDLKGTDEVYTTHCGGSAEPVRENLRRLCRAGVHLEVTTLVIPGLSDREEQLTAIAGFIAQELGPDVPWHISRFFPAFRMRSIPPTPLETLWMAETCGKKAGLQRIHLGNV